MTENTEIRIQAMFRPDPQSPGWEWAHILTFPVDLLNKMQFARNPYNWIRYATGVVVGAQGVLSTKPGSPDHVICNDDLPSTSMDLYYHMSDNERNRMYPIDPLMERTTLTSSVVTPGRNEFRRLVTARDGTCVLTDLDTVEATHLLRHSKGDDYIERYTRHQSRDPAENDVVTEIDDVRNGILLNPTAHLNFGKDFAFLITPNFAMTSADISPQWLKPETKICTAHLFVPGKEQRFGWPIASGSQVRMPTDYSEWPPDILFDAVYGNTMLHNFGTQTLRDGSGGWKSYFYPEGSTSPPEETQEASQDEQTSPRKRKQEQDHERTERAVKRLAKHADSADNLFDNLMIVPYILMRPERVKAFWRDAEEKRREMERSQLEEKVSNWAKGVTTNDDTGHA